jgi:hypothetical protein
MSGSSYKDGFTAQPSKAWSEMTHLERIEYNRQRSEWPCLWPDCVGGPDSACHGKKEPCK